MSTDAVAELQRRTRHCRLHDAPHREHGVLCSHLQEEANEAAVQEWYSEEVARLIIEDREHERRW